jgi:hypothetical protein
MENNRKYSVNVLDTPRYEDMLGFSNIYNDKIYDLLETNCSYYNGHKTFMSHSDYHSELCRIINVALPKRYGFLITDNDRSLYLVDYDFQTKTSYLIVISLFASHIYDGECNIVNFRYDFRLNFLTKKIYFFSELYGEISERIKKLQEILTTFNEQNMSKIDSYNDELESSAYRM